MCLKIKKYYIVYIALLLLLSGGCGKEEVQGSTGGAQEEMQEAQRELFAMDTYMTLTAYGEKSQEAFSILRFIP